MPFIKNIEKRIKISLWVALVSFITSIILSIIAFGYAYKMVAINKGNIYVLDKNRIPFEATLTDIGNNRKAEYIDAIRMFHDYFFNLPPDNDFINRQMNKAMYLIDASGLAEYNTLKEQGYYSDLVATSSVSTCWADSIVVDMSTKHWIFYGKQEIQRPSIITIRNLVTEGYLEDVPRTINNPHGALIIHWQTINNKDISSEAKQVF